MASFFCPQQTVRFSTQLLNLLQPSFFQRQFQIILLFFSLKKQETFTIPLSLPSFHHSFLCRNRAFQIKFGERSQIAKEAGNREGRNIPHHVSKNLRCYSNLDPSVNHRSDGSL